jgi:hypothetical protein
MRRLASVHETRRHAHRLARRDELLRNVSGFAHAGDDEFAAGLLAVQDGFDGRFEILFGGWAGAVEGCYWGQCCGFCGEHVGGVAEEIFVIVNVVVVVGLWDDEGSWGQRVFFV